MGGFANMRALRYATRGGRVLQVMPVRTARAQRAFVRLPERLYADDPCFVTPLRLERRMQLGPHNPYFRHARWERFVAWRDGRPVGRISAQVDALYEQTHGVRAGHFGVLDAHDDPGTVAALLDAAAAWLRGQGCTLMRGPFNLSINEECGLLVHGFDTPPAVLMGHGPAYLPAHVEAAGLRAVKELIAYRVDLDYAEPAASRRLLADLGPRLTDRPFDRRNWRADVTTLRTLFNAAWADNWDFAPFIEAEFNALGPLVRFIVPPGQVRIASLDGTPVGMIAALPNLNEFTADLHGRLHPWNAVRLVWRVLRRTPAGARVALMGIAPDLQKSALGAAVAFLMIRNTRAALVANGYRWVEMSWILEDNKGMRRIIEALGSDPYKRYRIYERAL